MALDFLRKYIEEKVVIGVDQNNNTLVIKEKDTNAKLREVKISGLNGDCFAFCLDSPQRRRFTNLFLKANAEKIHKGVDAVIFFQKEDEKYLLFCELKSNNPGNPSDKFASAEAFVDYLCSLSYRLEEKKLCQFKRGFIIFSSRSHVPKKPLNNGGSKKQKYTEIPFQDSKGHVYLNELLKNARDGIDCKKCPVFR